MKTEAEILEELEKLDQVENLDESGLVVRIITLVALQWILEKVPVSPSERLTKVIEEEVD